MARIQDEIIHFVVIKIKKFDEISRQVNSIRLECDNF